MPGPKNMTAKPKNFGTTLKRFLKAIRQWKIALIIASVLCVLSTILMIVGPMVQGQITTTAWNGITESGAIDWGAVSSLAILMLALYLLSAALNYIQGVVTARISAKFTQSLRTQMIEKMSRLSMSYFDEAKIGDVMSRMTNDVETVAGRLAETITQILTSVTMVIGILGMMMFISIPLSLVALVSIPLATLASKKIMDKSNHYFKRERKILGELNSAVEEDYTGQQIIAMNSHERESYEKFSNENDKLYEVSWKSQFFGSLAFPIVHIFTNISYVAICILGGYFTINGVIVIGNFQAFIQYVNRFNRPITEVAQINATIQQVMAAAERIFEFLDAEEEDISKSGREILPDAVKGDVEFHDVSFGYSAEKQVIKNFSTRIEAGKKVAIVGPTGAGKTTIVNLLMRFYDPNSGYITIDEVPTSELKRSNVRNLFGMVLQDTWLFSGTIRENLRYGSISSGKAATDEQIEAAIAAVGLKHFIESLPDGLDTKISEDSDNVSAGEKQLLTIARAMVADAPMMILDEATSNVDTRTEQLIQKAFNKLTDGRTSFVIAHRLSTIRDADIILVMRDGNIVEQGKHDDLLKLNGFYAELYNSQFAEG